jgi:hypothetical protein
MAQRGDQNGVLEHIGVVACVEGVSVTEHALMVALWPRSPQAHRTKLASQTLLFVQ